MSRGWGLVDLDVICKGKIRVGTSFLSGPEDRFSSLISGDCLGLWEVEGGDFIATSIEDATLDVRDLDVGLSIETVEVLHCEFA